VVEVNLEAMLEAPAAKRAFFHHMFHPHGAQACVFAGLFPTSRDVAEAEFAATNSDRRNYPPEAAAHVITRAREVSDMFSHVAEHYQMGCLDESEGDLRSLSLTELLVGFHVAMELEKLNHEQLVC
jgi:hypothetical protein